MERERTVRDATMRRIAVTALPLRSHYLFVFAVARIRLGAIPRLRPAAAVDRRHAQQSATLPRNHTTTPLPPSA